MTTCNFLSFPLFFVETRPYIGTKAASHETLSWKRKVLYYSDLIRGSQYRP